MKLSLRSKKLKNKKQKKENIKLKITLFTQNMVLAKLQNLKKLILVELMLRLMFLNLKKTKPMVWFLVNKQSHLRPLATINQVNEMYIYFKK